MEVLGREIERFHQEGPALSPVLVSPRSWQLLGGKRFPPGEWQVHVKITLLSLYSHTGLYFRSSYKTSFGRHKVQVEASLFHVLVISRGGADSSHPEL